jgi:hypothetical protein
MELGVQAARRVREPAWGPAPAAQVPVRVLQARPLVQLREQAQAQPQLRGQCRSQAQLQQADPRSAVVGDANLPQQVA